MTIPLVVPMDTPLDYPASPSVNLFHAVLLLGGVPLLLAIVIVSAVYLPAVVRGERVTPGHAPMDDQWIGGPRSSPAELTAGSSAVSGALGASGSSASDDTGTGGASGRW